VPHVRRLAAADRGAALRTVVSAFRADPLLRWWFPDDATYDALAARFFGVLLDTRLEGGEVWVTDGAGAVAMWIPPGGNLIGPDVVAARYGDMVTALPAPSAQRIAATDDVVDTLLPSEPHWYLGVLATRPDRRGSGLATAVCGPVFAAADRSGLPIVLETCTATNVAYYMRRGFSVIHQVHLGASNGATDPEPPTLRIMFRAPRSDVAG
jgi:GNAT superfamily N-acetyltransferase